MDKTFAESNNSCFQNQPPFMHNQFYSIPAKTVDFESELRGQTRNSSRCPSHKFNPSTDKFDTDNVVPMNKCANNDLVPEYTRLNKSCNVFAGVSINRFDYLCDDLQDITKIHGNSFIGSNTRLVIKDALKK